MFRIGDHIVHPMHGAGVIESIVQRKIDGSLRDYYALKLPVGGMLVMIPVDTCERIGVRGVMSADEARKIVECFSTLSIDMTSNWNQRYRENLQKIKSGDLMQVASVIKGLMQRDRERGLSTGERRMLHTAKQILISELILALDCDSAEIERALVLDSE